MRRALALLLALCLSLPASGQMWPNPGPGRAASGGGGGGGTAPSVVQSKANVAAGETESLAITFDSNVTSGNVIVVGFAGFLQIGSFSGATAGMLTKTGGTSTIGTITLDSQTFRSNGEPRDAVALYSVPVTGTGSLTLTFDSNLVPGSPFYVLVGSEVSGMDTSGTRVNDTSSANSSTSTAGASGDVATGGAGIIFGMLAPGDPYGNITATPDGAFTTVSEQEDDSQYNHSFIYRTVTSDTTDSADATWGTSASWVAAGVAYKSSDP